MSPPSNDGPRVVSLDDTLNRYASGDSSGKLVVDVDSPKLDVALWHQVIDVHFVNEESTETPPPEHPVEFVCYSHRRALR